jgi:hypothetical protein
MLDLSYLDTLKRAQISVLRKTKRTSGRLGRAEWVEATTKEIADLFYVRTVGKFYNTTSTLTSMVEMKRRLSQLGVHRSVVEAWKVLKAITPPPVSLSLYEAAAASHVPGLHARFDPTKKRRGRRSKLNNELGIVINVLSQLKSEHGAEWLEHLGDKVLRREIEKRAPPGTKLPQRTMLSEWKKNYLRGFH